MAHEHITKLAAFVDAGVAASTGRNEYTLLHAAPSTTNDALGGYHGDCMLCHIDMPGHCHTRSVNSPLLLVTMKLLLLLLHQLQVLITFCMRLLAVCRSRS